MVTTIHAFDPQRRTNADLMVDCHTLGYLPEPVLDLTYGKGAFWTKLPDLDVHANDLHPEKGKSNYDFTDTPWHDRSWPCVVFDPPYAIRGASSDPHFEDRYGLDFYRTRREIKEMIGAGTAEACRLSSKYVLVKVQDHVSSADVQPLTTWALNAATGTGARLLDSLHVVGGRKQPAGRRQVRARHDYSTLLVIGVGR